MSVVVILGAHTPTGKTLVEILDERDVGAEVVAATTSEFIDDGLVLLDADVLGRGDLYVLCMSGSFAAKIAEGLVSQGKLLIDAVGASELPLSACALLANPQLESSVRVPLSLVEPVAALLQALNSFTPKNALVTTYESAASEGREGIEELSDQTRRVFTMDAKDPEVFSASLAFDAIPRGEALEAEFEADVAALGFEMPLMVRRTLVPSFSAEAASVQIEFAAEVGIEEIKTVLQAAPGVRLTDGLAPSLDAVGRDDFLVGHLRIKGPWLSLWVACDRQRRGGATQAALWVETWAAGTREDKKS